MASQKIEQIRPANAGVDLASAPEALGQQAAAKLSDFLTDRPGKLTPRGPLIGAALGGSVDAIAALTTPASLMIAKLDTSVGTRKIMPWEANLGLAGRTAANETDLVRAHVNLRAVNRSTFVASDQAMTDIGLIPGPRSTVLNGLTYAISLDSAGELAGGDTVTLADGTSKAHKTELLSIDTSGSALPTFPNPSFDTNTTGWTNGTTSISRQTFDFDSSPASGKMAASGTVTTTLAGTFKQGVTYTLSFKAEGPGGGASIAASLAGLGSISAFPLNAVPAWQQVTPMTFTPGANTTNPVLTLTSVGAVSIDSFTLTQTTAAKAGVNAPMCAQDVKAYLSRLFVLGGAAPGSAASALVIKNRTLWWTDPGGPIFSDLNSWKDDVSGLVNQLQVGPDDPTDPGVALGVLPTQLLVFGRRSLWAVLGSSPSNFTVRRVAQLGCLDPRSVIEYADAVYWLSEQGYMRYDGASLTNMSAAIQPTLLAAADQSVGRGGVPGGTALATVLPNSYCLLSIGRRDTNAQLLNALLHVPTGAWATLTSGAQSGVIRASVADQDSWVCDGSTAWLANGATHPERNALAYLGAALTDATKDSIITLAAGVITVSSSSKITPFWRSRMLELSSPLMASQLLRFLQDYAYTDPGQTADDVTNGWHVALKDSLGNTLATFDLGTQGTSSTKVRRRFQSQVFDEVSSDAALEVSIPGAAPAWTIAELYTGELAFEPTRDRGGE